MTDEERELLRVTQEVGIETTAGAGEPAHRAIIWIVVDATDRVLLRTYLGAHSRWYREATASGRCTILVDGRSIEFAVEPATDAERIAACSDGLRAKYRSSASLDAMLRPEVLPTTLELRPRDGALGPN